MMTLLPVLRQRMFAALSVSLFLMGICSSFYGPYLSLFGVREVGMSPMALGLFMSASTLAGIAASTAVGFISDAGAGRKRLLMGAIAAGMAGYAVFAFSRHYAVLLLASLVFLSFSRSTFPQLFALSGEIDMRGREENRALVTGILRAIFAVGWVVGPVIAAFLLEASGFTALYLTVVVIFGLLLAIVGLFVREHRRSRARRASASGKPAVNRVLALNAASFSIIYLATGLNAAALPLFVTETLGASSRHVGFLLGLAAALEIPLMIAGSFLVRRIGTLKPIKVGMACYIAYSALVALAHDPLFLYPVQLLNAMAISQIMSIGISHFQQLDPDRPGTTITLFNNTTAVGNVLAGAVFGAIVTQFDYRTVYAFVSVFAALALGLLRLAGNRREPEP